MRHDCVIAMQPEQQVQYEQPQAYSPDQVGVYPQNVTHPQIAPVPGNVIYVQAPKYSNNAVRMWTYIILGLGILIGIIGWSSDSYLGIGLGTMGFCGMLWACLIPEVIFYHGMVNHNNSNGQGTGWAITNLVFGYLLLAGGAISLFFMMLDF
jgi:hypothetical protein